VVDLDDAGDLGLVLVYTREDRDEVLHVLDAPTGEELGILELRDQTSAIDVSAEGGLLLQRRAEDVVSWRIVR
jgi:hypothetical protein